MTALRASGAARECPPDEVVIEAEAVDALIDLGGIELLRELVEDYDVQARGACVALREAVARRDATTVAKISHILKGSSQSLGATRAGELFADLERMGKRAALDGNAAEIAGHLPVAVADAIAALRRRCA
jgi:hypothetical protein